MSIDLSREEYLKLSADFTKLEDFLRERIELCDCDFWMFDCVQEITEDRVVVQLYDPFYDSYSYSEREDTVPVDWLYLDAEEFRKAWNARVQWRQEEEERKKAEAKLQEKQRMEQFKLEKERKEYERLKEKFENGN